MTAYENWREDAACLHADPDLFFPVGTTGPALAQACEAKRICRACPAQTQCLAWALDHGVTDGVWGGTTADERRAIRRRNAQLTRNQEDHDGDSYQRTEHREYGIPAPTAQAKAAGLFRGPGTGRGPAVSGASPG